MGFKTQPHFLIWTEPYAPRVFRDRLRRATLAERRRLERDRPDLCAIMAEAANAQESGKELVWCTSATDLRHKKEAFLMRELVAVHNAQEALRRERRPHHESYTRYLRRLHVAARARFALSQRYAQISMIRRRVWSSRAADVETRMDYAREQARAAAALQRAEQAEEIAAELAEEAGADAGLPVETVQRAVRRQRQTSVHEFFSARRSSGRLRDPTPADAMAWADFTKPYERRHFDDDEGPAPFPGE